MGWGCLKQGMESHQRCDEEDFFHGLQISFFHYVYDKRQGLQPFLEIVNDKRFDDHLLFQKRIVGDRLDESPMGPAVLIEPFQLIKSHGTEKAAGSDMH